MATMDPGQRGFGQQRQFNIPDLPFSTPGNMDRFLPSSHRGRGPGGMRPQGQIPPELLELLMAQLFGGQGGGRPPQRPPMGGGRPPMGRPPMGGPQRGGQRPPMGSGRPPVIKIEDLVRALSGGGAQRQAPQANMPVPQARR